MERECRKRICMESEAESDAWRCAHHPHLLKKPKPSSSFDPHTLTNSNFKTQLCRRFRHGLCSRGSDCNYAHGVSDLRLPSSSSFHSSPKLCRFFLQHKRCFFGPSCRFRHSSIPTISPLPPPPPPEQGKLDQRSSSEYRTMQATSAAAAATTMDGYSSAEHGIKQNCTAATNASVATSYLHKKEPCAVKCIFKTSDLQKISRIYADWI